MRYMLMMNVPRGTGDYQISSWSQKELEAHIAFMHTLNKELTEAGGRGGAGPSRRGQGRPRRQAGVPAVTDGPFPEAKEFLAGFWIVDVDSADRAYQIAAKASAAPGPGGAPLIIPIEVRQVMSAPLGDA